MSDEVKPWRGQWRVKAAVINGEPLPVSRAKPAKALTVVVRGADGGEQELRGEGKAVGR